MCHNSAVAFSTQCWTKDLEVKVGNLSGVEVVDALQDLLDELSGFLLAQRLLLCQEIKELAARDPATAILAALSEPLLPTTAGSDSRRLLTAPG